MKPRIVQVAMCTADLARTVRRYVDIFGFQDAGAHVLWGSRLAALQRLGDDATVSLWWLVGAQELVQIELFHHSDPPQRPLPPEWLPNNFGWTRWGVAVSDFDAVLDRLQEESIPLSEIVTSRGLQRACFRDPDIGVITEIMEEGTELPGSTQSESDGDAPRIVYVTMSLPDMTTARKFYLEVLKMELTSERLHEPEMEAMWGLPDARVEAFVADGDGVFLEVVCYSSPVGEVNSPDRRLSDQGIMNIALGYRERRSLEDALSRAIEAGSTMNAPLGGHMGGATYITDPQGQSLEMLCLPVGFEEAYGFVARPSFPPAAVPSAAIAAENREDTRDDYPFIGATMARPK